MLITEAIAISKSVSRAPKMNLGTSYSIQQEILKSLPIKCFSSDKLMTYIVYMLDLQLLAYLCICCNPTSFALQLHTYYVTYFKY